MGYGIDVVPRRLLLILEIAKRLEDPGVSAGVDQRVVVVKAGAHAAPAVLGERCGVAAARPPTGTALLGLLGRPLPTAVQDLLLDLRDREGGQVSALGKTQPDLPLEILGWLRVPRAVVAREAAAPVLASLLPPATVGAEAGVATGVNGVESHDATLEPSWLLGRLIVDLRMECPSQEP